MPAPLSVEWSPRAARDLADIHDYIAADRPKTAAEIKQSLVAAGDSLSLFPNRGREAGRSRELVAVYPFIMRYRVTSVRVVILRIKHGARQP
jgi:plasmid stabilization system protein ParE